MKKKILLTSCLCIAMEKKHNEESQQKLKFQNIYYKLTEYIKKNFSQIKDIKLDIRFLIMF